MKPNFIKHRENIDPTNKNVFDYDDLACKNENNLKNLHYYTDREEKVKILYFLRQQAISSDARRIVVFCAPKSGSTFISSVIGYALNCNKTLLTSYFNFSMSEKAGLNGREQELDEFALILRSLQKDGNFVAQHHTKCTPFLCTQIKFYNIYPIVTYRNVYDTLVSFDDMVLHNRKLLGNTQRPWFLDSAITLPARYPENSLDHRLGFLAHTLGIWLVNFYVSWKRCESLGLVTPLWLSYERDFLNEANFIDKIAKSLITDFASLSRLINGVQNPPPGVINVGKRGRGKRVPRSARIFLENYAAHFSDDLKAEGIEELLG